MDSSTTILSKLETSTSLISSNKFDVDKYFQICFEVVSLGSNLNSSYGDRFNNISQALSSLESYKIKILLRSFTLSAKFLARPSNCRYDNRIRDCLDKKVLIQGFG